MLSILFSALASAQSPKYGKCNPNKFERTDLKNVSIPITAVLTKTPITISGNIVIVDGCNFEVRDFIYINGQESYFMGGYKGSDQALTLSDQFITASAIKAVFKYPLRQEAGAEANFDGFDQFRIFERNTKVLVATADMPAKEGGTTGSTDSTTGSSAFKAGEAISMTIVALLALIL